MTMRDINSILKAILSRWSALFLAAALLLCPHNLTAQRRGGVRSGGNGGSGKVPPGPAATDFERQIEIQATPDQIAEFKTLTKSIEAAGHRVQGFMKLAGSEPHPEDYSLQVIGVRDLLEKAEDDSEIFLGSFSDKQKSRFKAQVKKMSKAGSELTRHIKVLEQESENPALNHDRLVKLTDDLDKALTNLKAEQFNLGKLLGVPDATGTS